MLALRRDLRPGLDEPGHLLPLREPVSGGISEKTPRGFSDFGEASLSVASILAPSLGPVVHLCTRSRDLDAHVARVDSYDVMLK